MSHWFRTTGLCAACMALILCGQLTHADAIGETNQQTPTINQAANTGRSSQNAGQMMNMIASAALFASCLSSEPPNMPLCMMGALAAIQAGQDAGAADASGLTFDASAYSPTGLDDGTNGTTLTPASDNGKTAFSNPAIDKGMTTLKNAGFTATADGITKPDGTTIPASAFNSDSGMLAAGLDPASVAAADQALASIKKKLADNPSVSGMGVSNAGGSGGSGGYAGGSGTSSDFAMNFPKFKNPFANPNKAKLVAGKSLNYNGEPIGVKGDDIFEMVHRAYVQKRKGGHFIEDPLGRTHLRLPASTRGH